jgi:eukaryotic-like serine/threonine-protein kinase
MADPQPGDAQVPAPTLDQPTIIEPRGAEPSPGPGLPAPVDLANMPLYRLGDYELLQEIGRGGMGVVFKARHVKLNRIVALKMVLGGALATADDLQRFNTEAAAAAQLQHPGIVALYEAGTYDQQPYFSMEFVQGSSLAQMVAAAGPLPGPRAAGYLEKTARAVHYAHCRGIIHRDLKPANVLVDEHDNPKITDFGLAKLIEIDSGQTRTGTVIGTPSYMSPEQAAARKNLGAASDIYSLGAILYELITGRPPFRGDTALATLAQVAEVEPTSPRLLRKEIHVDLETICMKCLAKEPHRRYATAEALADDLRRYLDAEPITARPLSRLQWLVVWCRRKPTAAALVGVSLAGLLAVVSAAVAFAVLEIESAKEERRLRRDAQRLQIEAEDASKLAQKRFDGMGLLFYLAEMRQAQQAIEAANIDRARTLLAKYKNRPDLRDWEWYYLWDLSHGRFTLDGHGDRATALAYRPDGRQLASAGGPPGGPGVVKIWDTANGRLLHTLEGHKNRITAVAYAPDGKWIVTGGGSSFDGTVRLWDADTGTLLMTFPDFAGGNAYVTGMAFHPSGKQLVTADSAGQVRLWSLEHLRQKDFEPSALGWTAHKEGITCVAFSPDGQWLATAGVGREIKLWDPTRQTAMRTLPHRHQGRITSLAFSHDGTLLASGGGRGVQAGEIFVWDVGTGEPRYAFTGLNDVALSVALSPQGHLAAGCNDGLIRIWIKPRPSLPFSGEPVRFRADTLGVNALVYSGDGRHLASAGHDGRIRVWNGTGGQVAVTLPSAEDSNAVVFSSDGRLVAAAIGHAGMPGEVRVWGLDNPSRILHTLKHPEAVVALAINSKGTLLATACEDKQVRLIDLATSAEPRLLGAAPAGELFRAQVRAVAFSPDGLHLATAGEDDKIRLWNVASGAMEQVFEGHTDYVLAIAFNQDGKQLVSASMDKTVRLWDLSGGHGRGVVVLGQHKSWALSVAFSADGKLVASGGQDKRVRLWHVETLTAGRVLDGAAGGVLTVALHPDGRRVVGAGEDKVVRMWDLVTGQEVLELEGSVNKVNCVTFSRDGHWLAAAGQNPTIRLWQAPRLE